LGPGPDRVQLRARRDKQRTAIGAAEADVGRPGLAGGDVVDLLTSLVVGGDALVVGDVDVALIVDRHAVGAGFAKELLVRERTVGLHGVRVGLVSVEVGDVEHLAVRGADDAVGLGEVGGDAGERLAIGGEVVDVVAILLLGAALPVVALVPGVGEVHA